MIKTLAAPPRTQEESEVVPAGAEKPLDASALVREAAPFVWRTLRYLGVDESQLGDVSQEVLITLFRKAHTFEGRSAVKTWVYRICERAAHASRRRTGLERSRTGGSDQEVEVRTSEQIEARLALNSALARLDDEKRLVFVLYEIEGLSMREICEIAECPLQTGYSRLHAARRLVERAFEEPAGGRQE